MIKPKNISKPEPLVLSNAQILAFVMKTAWKIARGAAKKFGGKAKDFLGESMKEAWFLAKAAKGGAKTTQQLTDFVLSRPPQNLPKDAVIKGILASAVAGVITISDISTLMKIFF